MSQPFDNRDSDVRQIAEKDQEIERLKALIRQLRAEIEGLKAELRKVESLWFSEHYRLRDLLKRAADALEEEFGPGNTDLMVRDPWALIAELRKAAL